MRGSIAYHQQLTENAMGLCICSKCRQLVDTNDFDSGNHKCIQDAMQARKFTPIDSNTFVDRKLVIGACHSFIADRTPRGSLQRPGSRLAGTIVAIRGNRVTLQDGSGFRYTVDRTQVRS